MEALSALEAWRSACAVLDEGTGVLDELLVWVRDHGVKGKQVHDANIVATMRSNGIVRLATLKLADFKRFEDDIEIASIVT